MYSLYREYHLRFWQLTTSLTTGLWFHITQDTCEQYTCESLKMGLQNNTYIPAPDTATNIDKLGGANISQVGGGGKHITSWVGQTYHKLGGANISQVGGGKHITSWVGQTYHKLDFSRVVGLWRFRVVQKALPATLHSAFTMNEWAKWMGIKN